MTHLTKTPPRDTPDTQSASGDLISARRVHQEATPGDPRVKETTSATGLKIYVFVKFQYKNKIYFKVLSWIRG